VISAQYFPSFEVVRVFSCSKWRKDLMSRKQHPVVFHLLRPLRPLAVVSAVVTLMVINAGPADAQLPPIGLTQAGSPIWRPTDFQLFTAPADPFPDAFFGTIDLLLPLEGPGAAVYTPHDPPYDAELSTNAAAAGFVNRSVFPRSAITLNPNGVYFSYMLLPDPGVTGSSRDFASGPVIPNSLFPLTTHAEMYLDGVLVETLQDGTVEVRAGDVGFDGASHRAPTQVVWHPWANDPNAGPLGSHELRWSLRDNQGNGWDMVAPFTVVPEPSALSITLTAVMASLMACRTRRS
jgi:hypothetical protein